MEKRTFSIVSFCKKTKITRKGKAPIYVRITTRGQSTEIYTQWQIEPQKWNQKTERSLCRDKISVQINDILASYRANIPLEAYEYVVNGKSAIEWIMERYDVRTDKNSGIKNDPNEWATEHGDKSEYIYNLLMRIITVYVESMRVVHELPKLKFEE